MHAIINQGDGKYYISAVFGYYRNVTAVDDYQHYLEEIHNPYYIVWDSEKKRLIKWLAMVPNTKYIIPQILIVDANRDDWIIDEHDEGCVSFLDKKLIDNLLSIDEQSDVILKKCRDIDKDYVFNEYTEVKSISDIENIELVSGGFHDARICEEKLQKDGSLYVKFDGIWGCEIEMWFWGDLEYDTSSRNPEKYDPFWLSATIILREGFVYLVDEEDMKVEDINSNYCYFKARNMKYRVIPISNLNK